MSAYGLNLSDKQRYEIVEYVQELVNPLQPKLRSPNFEELNQQLDDAIRQGSQKQLMEGIKLLVLELAYYKVKHTVNPDDALVQMDHLPPTQLAKVLSEARAELVSVFSKMGPEGKGPKPLALS